MRCNQMYSSIPPKRWFFMCPKQADSDARDMRYEMTDHNQVKLAQMSQDPKMIMIIVPNNAGDRYAATKRLTCVNNAIPTQVKLTRRCSQRKPTSAVFCRLPVKL